MRISPNSVHLFKHIYRFIRHYKTYIYLSIDDFSKYNDFNKIRTTQNIDSVSRAIQYDKTRE